MTKKLVGVVAGLVLFAATLALLRVVFAPISVSLSEQMPEVYAALLTGAIQVAIAIGVVLLARRILSRV